MTFCYFLFSIQEQVYRVKRDTAFEVTGCQYETRRLNKEQALPRVCLAGTPLRLQTLSALPA